MRSFRAASAAVLALSMLLTGGATLPSYADPQGPAPQRPTLPEQASDRAEEALQVAQDVLAGVDRSVEPTIALRDLFLLRGDLTGRDRDQADQLLARPDGQTPPSDDQANFDYFWHPSQEARPLCNARICVHYVTSGDHAATYREARATLANVTRSWRVEIGSLGYRAPRRDGTRGDRRWADSKGRLDVYLAEVGLAGIFGYAVPESEPGATADGNPRNATGYLVLDNDFANFGCPSPANCRRVTAAHELFHLVQFAYTTRQHSWFMESTATWVEERVFDGINDNRHYLPYGQLKYPSRQLDEFDPWGQGDQYRKQSGYGNWLLHEFYTQRKGDIVVKRAWYYASRGKNWRQALAGSLNRAGWSWPAMYTAYAANNNLPAVTYPEGRAFRSAATGPVRTTATFEAKPTLPPHSSASYRFFPGHDKSESGPTGPQITFDVTLSPGINHRAYVVVVQDDGTVRRYLVRLDSEGAGSRTFPFSQDGVRFVTLTLVNASTRSATAGFVSAT